MQGFLLFLWRKEYRTFLRIALIPLGFIGVATLKRTGNFQGDIREPDSLMRAERLWLPGPICLFVRSCPESYSPKLTRDEAEMVPGERGAEYLLAGSTSIRSG